MPERNDSGAWRSIGLEHLRAGRAHDGLIAYAAAVRADEDVGAALRELEEPPAAPEPGRGWVLRFLRVALAAREVNSLYGRRVVIVAGGTAAGEEARIARYRRLLLDGFRDYEGVLISGGTTAGIAGLVGDLQSAYGDRLYTIGYLPATMPDAQIDSRYRELRHTDGDDFSPLEVVQYWADLVAAGVAPGGVGLLGINGGAIAQVEFRVALALGAQVGVIAGSGRAADELPADPFWATAANLTMLAADGAALRGWLAWWSGGGEYVGRQ